MWNKAPITITTCKNVIGVKREIKFFCKNPSNLNNLNNLNNMNNLKIENKKIEKLKNFKNIISITLRRMPDCYSNCKFIVLPKNIYQCIFTHI